MWCKCICPQIAANALQSSLKSLGDQVGELEFRVSSNQDNITDLEQRIETLEKQNTLLIQKAEDAENRSRALNLRFIHIPERAEGTDTIGFIEHLLTQLFGEDNFPTPPVIERAHRIPGASSKPNSRSGARTILVKFIHFRDKLKILSLAREKKELKYQGSRVFIYPDFSHGLTQKRRLFDPVKKKLREMGIRYALLYPATLRIHIGEVAHLCNSPDESEVLIRDVLMKSP